MSTRTLIKIFAAGFSSVAAVVVLALWFLPYGTGEYRESPDGKYIADVQNLNSGTWFAGRVSYIEFELTDIDTRRTVCLVRYYHNGNNVPAYGDRSQSFLSWAPDSSSVTFPILNGQHVTFPVP